MSSDFSRIYGNDTLKQLFTENICNGSLPHAIILEGACGSGRYTFALHITAAMLCTDISRPCFKCKNCRQIFEGRAPDVQVIGLPEDRATISVDSVRFIRSDAQSVPVEGELKFYIIRDSDEMTVQAQNALLKTLEEPPSFVVFILLSENSELLLPTIRSRAPVFRMQRFGDDELTEYITSVNKDAKRLYDTDPRAFAYLIKSANGCIGAVMNNLNKRSLSLASKEYDTVSGILTSLAGNDKSVFMSYEDDLPSKREDLRDVLSVIRCGIRDLTMCKKSDYNGFMFFDSENTVKKLSKSFTLLSLMKMLEATESALSSNEMNANVNLLKINYMCTLWKSVH